MRPTLLRTQLDSVDLAPASISARAEFRLKGHSGAEVMLCAEGATSLVRKTAGSPAQNDRLLRQAAKQRELSTYRVRLPRILRDGVDVRGHAFFEMEYVPARTLATILRDGGPFDAARVEAALERTLSFFRFTAGAPVPAILFHGKIAQIAAQAGTPVARLAARLSAMNWDNIPSSVSHGDMTLENILVCEARGVVFIDCDDCFASSYWLDVAKLCQDALGHWCVRDLYLQEAGNIWLNATQRLGRMAQTVHGIAARLDPDMMARLPQLTALHLLRALPYAQSRDVADFILQRAHHVLGDAS